MAANSSTLAWRMPWTEEPGSSWDCKESDMTEQLTLSLGSPGGSHSKESTCNTGDLDSNPGLGRSPREGNGSPLQCSGLEKEPHGQRSLSGYS